MKQKEIYKFVNKYYKDGINVTLDKLKYHNGNNALELTTTEDEPFMVASSNLDFPLEENQVMIKNYSENEGVKEFLLMNNIIEDEIKTIDLGFVVVTIHKFTDKFLSSI